MHTTIRLLVGVICLIFGDIKINALDNGLALTPPMGWMTWQRFRCTIDCDKYPNECISDALIRRTADKMASDGYLASGYEYLVIDDCWLAKTRGSNDQLMEDPKRFPKGMKDLVNYVHSKGLKFGIYEDYGTKTCAGYPGMQGFVKADVAQFADWGIDYIKVDGCNHKGVDYEKDYAELSYLLNKTGRPILYSCSYPAYQNDDSTPFDYAKLAANCNSWRNYDDIDDSWESVTKILDYFAIKQEYITQFHGPGHWNDPDMLVIGNYGLSYDQSKVQMGLWSILGAPLLMSVDLDTIRPEFKDILQNEKVIAINQDPLGLPGTRVYKAKSIEVWTKRVTPYVGDQYSQAIAFYSRRTDGTPFEMTVILKNIGLKFPYGYHIQNLFDGTRLNGRYYPADNVTVRVNPTGIVLLKAVIVQSETILAH